MPCSVVDYTREEAIDVFGLEAKRGPQTPTDRVSAIMVLKDDRKQDLNRHNVGFFCQKSCLKYVKYLDLE